MRYRQLAPEAKFFLKNLKKKTLDHSGQFFDTKSGNLDVAIRFKTAFYLTFNFILKINQQTCCLKTWKKFGKPGKLKKKNPLATLYNVDFQLEHQ